MLSFTTVGTIIACFVGSIVIKAVVSVGGKSVVTVSFSYRVLFTLFGMYVAFHRVILMVVPTGVSTFVFMEFLRLIP